jgi:hypothetical protein
MIEFCCDSPRQETAHEIGETYTIFIMFYTILILLWTYITCQDAHRNQDYHFLLCPAHV